jgi:predicted RNA methylase
MLLPDDAVFVTSIITYAAENLLMLAPPEASIAAGASVLPRKISTMQKLGFRGSIDRLSQKISTMRKLGCRGSIDHLLTEAEDYWFDIKHGTDTAQFVQLADLDIRSRNRQRGVEYAPTPASDFKRLMNALEFPSGSVFVDLGSGKGKTLMMASEYEFKRVVGIEFSSELCETAQRNWSIYRNGIEAGADFEIANSDVVDYEIKDDENVFFMYNPFDAVVMGKVIQNIDTSLKIHPRRIWIIYHNPVCHELLEGQGTFLRIATVAQRAGSFAVYMR